jgi:hypothetical protein
MYLAFQAYFFKLILQFFPLLNNQKQICESHLTIQLKDYLSQNQ